MYTALTIEAVRLQTIVAARRLVHRRAQAGDAHMAVTLGLRLVNVEANAEDARQRMRDRTKFRGAAGLDDEGVDQAPAAGRGRLLRHPADGLLGDPEPDLAAVGDELDPEPEGPVRFPGGVARRQPRPQLGQVLRRRRSHTRPQTQARRWRSRQCSRRWRVAGVGSSGGSNGSGSELRPSPGPPPGLNDSLRGSNRPVSFIFRSPLLLATVPETDQLTLVVRASPRRP